ncbi:MAG: hypothetical protein P1U39_04490 [Legionellaceae bacterium]|nr:hypothetical protein [Legionellaceae bacterium]
MGVLFYKHNDQEANHKQENKLNKLSFLLEKYNLSAHDDDNARSERLQAVVNHLETMTLTPSLCQWIEYDLAEHLKDYELTSELSDVLTSMKP